MRTQTKETLEFKLVEHSECLVLMGTTMTDEAKVTLELTSDKPLKNALPIPARDVEYRLCPEDSQVAKFTVSSTAPYAFAAVQCPRSKEEQTRTRADDETTSGLGAVRKVVTQLTQAGCLTIQEPIAKSGQVKSTITAKASAPCITFLAKAHFADTVLSADVQPRNSNIVVTPSGSDIRVVICSAIDREYALEIEANNDDFFAIAAADCPRYGAEGFALLRKLQGVPMNPSTDRPKAGSSGIPSATSGGNRTRITVNAPQPKPQTSGAVPMDWSKPRRP